MTKEYRKPSQFSDATKVSINELNNRDSATNQQGYKIIRSDFDFTNISTSYANTIWEIRYKHDLGGNDVVLPENVTLYFNGGMFMNANTITGSETKIKSELYQIFLGITEFSGIWDVVGVMPKWFGVMCDGVTDDSGGIEDAIKFAANSGREVVFDNNGNEYIINTAITIDQYDSIKIKGKGKPVLNFGATLLFNNSPILETVITSSLVRGDYDISCGSVVGVKVGDIFVIEDSKVFETNWGRGSREISTVVGVSGSIITLSNPVNIHHDVATVVVQFYEPRTVSVDGIVIKSSTSSSLRVVGSYESKFSDIKIIEDSRGQNYDGIVLSKSVATNFDKIDIDGCRYGILPAVCRDLTLNNCTSLFCRHPISPLFSCDGVSVNGLTGYKNVSTIDIHVAFNVSYKNVVALSDDEIPNARGLGVVWENISVYSEYAVADLSPYIHVINNLVSDYDYLKTAYDFTAENVDWNCPNKSEFGATYGNRVIYKNVLTNGGSYGVGKNESDLVNEFIVEDVDGQRGNVRISAEAFAIKNRIIDAEFDASDSVYEINTFNVLTERKSGKCYSSGVVLKDSSVDPLSIRIRLYTHVMGTVNAGHNPYSFIMFKLVAYVRHSNGGSFDIVEKVFHFFHKKGATSSFQLPTSPAFESSPTGQSNESLALSVSNGSQNGSSQESDPANHYIEFDVDISSGRTSPVYSLTYESEIMAGSF